ncbi:MAG: hypothetical protein ABJC74_11410 [Gemmatimonadota bacterium]
MAIVGGVSALGGAVAGGIAALIAARVLRPSEPVTTAQIALMVVEYGFVAGVAGSVLGTIVAFGALRRVPLGQLVLGTNAGLFAGLCAGWLGGPWAWHHMELLAFGGFGAGALVARAFSRGSPVSRSSLALDPVPVSPTIGSAAPAMAELPRLPQTGDPEFQPKR